MKKMLLATMLLVSQLALASSPKEVNECFNKVKHLSDKIIELSKATPVYEKSSDRYVLTGKSKNGQTCAIEIEHALKTGKDKLKEKYEEVSISMKSQTKGFIRYFIQTYHSEVIDPGMKPFPAKKVDFKVGQCLVKENTLNAKLSFSQLYSKYKLEVKDLKNGSVEFTSYMNSGVIFTKGIQDTCIVNLNN